MTLFDSTYVDMQAEAVSAAYDDHAARLLEHEQRRSEEEQERDYLRMDFLTVLRRRLDGACDEAVGLRPQGSDK
jgi:hypothetical protein